LTLAIKHAHSPDLIVRLKQDNQTLQQIWL
jgi:hypothetical protein